MEKSEILKELKRNENGRIILDSLNIGVDCTVSEEQKGKRDKKWLNFEDKRFLVKYVKPNTYEDYAELLVEQLCRQLNIPSASYDLGILNNQPCVITEDFLDKSCERLISGKTFTSSSVEILTYNGTYI